MTEKPRPRLVVDEEELFVVPIDVRLEVVVPASSEAVAEALVASELALGRIAIGENLLRFGRVGKAVRR